MSKDGRVSLCADDLMNVNGRIMADLTDSDVCVIELPNKIVNGKKGKNGNIVFSYNTTGEQANVKLRVLKGSPDDKFLNEQINLYRNNKAGYILMTGSFTKRLGDGTGKITNEVYNFSAGIIDQIPGAKDNPEGDTEQGTSEYNILYMNTNRGFK